METTRFILFMALGLVMIAIWQAWHADYDTEIASMQDSSAVTMNGSFELNDKADLPTVAVNEKRSMTQSSVDTSMTNVDIKGDIIQIKTDVLDVEINTLGGTVQKLSLLDYPISKKEIAKPVILLNDKIDNFYLIQSGLLSEGDAANHKAVFSVDGTVFKLDGQDQLSIPFVWQSETGLEIIKTYTFYKGKYIVDISHQVINKSGNEWSGRAYAQINRTRPEKDRESLFIYTYTGAVISSPDKRYEKISFDDIEDEPLSIDLVNSWVAMLQHYFVAALIPGSKSDKYHYYTLNPNGKNYIIGAASPPQNVAIGETGLFNQRAYLGPKLQKELPEIAEGLELTVDYGIFWLIAKPLYFVLDQIHSATHNWGWSIVLVTLLLKVIFYRLSASGYRSMANMRKVQPRLLAIRERYKDDRTRLNQAMMEIYKEEKINPLGGCFPILVQIPFFISLYWVLLETVELRQADFILWINDLSVPDPLYVLPLLMGLTMIVQHKLNPAPVDPVQQKVMSILPIVFTVFFIFFPAGLVLYWVVNNFLSIVQQWFITRSIEKAA